VMLAIGTRWSVVCTQAIAPAERARVLMHLRAGTREVIEIEPAAMQAFAGNLLELQGFDAGRMRTVLVMSARARAALSADTSAWERLRASVDEIVSVAVPTIEMVGGGSVRCMMAEIPAVTA
ncbi:MAG: arginine deiminase-related protein, partial [Steroidobacteraceae bacterium]